MVTVTLFDIIQSELIKDGHSEFLDDEGNLVFFNEEYQFTEKILNYDEDVKKIIRYIFHNVSLDNNDHDTHFKKMFLYRFINREINRQTIEAFKMQLMSVFLENKEYINRVYNDSELFILQKSKSTSDNIQLNNQMNESNSLSNNRQAFAELPQSHVNLDVDSPVMRSANDNTISNNRQQTNSTNEGETIGNSRSGSETYSIDELIKSSHLMVEIMNTFDRKCFLQIW